MDYWVKQYIPEFKRCRVDEANKEKEKKFAYTLVDFSSVFLLLGFGLGLSIVSFVAEIAIDTMYCHRK